MLIEIADKIIKHQKQ